MTYQSTNLFPPTNTQLWIELWEVTGSNVINVLKGVGGRGGGGSEGHQ